MYILKEEALNDSNFSLKSVHNKIQKTFVVFSGCSGRGENFCLN